MGDGRGPGEMLLRVLDTDPLDIEMIGDLEALKVAEMADAMVEAVRAATEPPSTRQLREMVKGHGGTDLQTKALDVLKTGDPLRLISRKGK
ncbi:MAG: hypothetical protein H0V26_09080 [Solirubrobacterales bacterium]|nr:hypothetical protein [Solirubrobacterales bacterium]